MPPTRTATSTSTSTKARTNNSDHKYAIAQAYIRGYLARKAYKKLVKKQAHRASVAKEMLTTEQSYVKSLETMIEVYLVPLREDPKKHGITREEVQVMFANIETIVNLHKEILKLMTHRVNAWSNIQKIGDIFINFAPFLKMLNGYCSNYDAAITTLSHVRQDRKTFSMFLEKCETTETVQILPSYLIQPIQRVPRYNLLLEEMIRSTWEWHNDYEALCNSLRAMKQIADHINESLHKSEKANKVVKIQSDLGGECVLVEPHRRWIKDGPVTRVKRQGQTSSPVSTNKLWIYLFNDMIVFAGRILLSYRFIEKYALESTSIQDIGGSDKFQIASVAAQSAYILAAESEENKNEWLAAITAAVQNYSTSIPDIKSEQRKTIERESSLHINRDSASLPSHTPSAAHSSLPVQSQQQQQQNQATPKAHLRTLPLPSYSPPPMPSQAPRPPQNRPATPSALMKFDFASMPVTEGGEEEEEMTFQERRLMFERGLLPQAQVIASPRKPSAKIAAKSSPKSPSSKTHAHAHAQTQAPDKQRGDLPSSPTGSHMKTPQPISARSHAMPHKLPEIPQGIVGELKLKYHDNDNDMNSPLLGKEKDKLALALALAHSNKTTPPSNPPPTTSTSPPTNKNSKKDSSCCVIL